MTSKWTFKQFVIFCVKKKSEYLKIIEKKRNTKNIVEKKILIIIQNLENFSLNLDYLLYVIEKLNQWKWNISLASGKGLLKLLINVTNKLN